MAVAISAAVAPNCCTPSLHGPSRLSRASSSGAMLPPTPTPTPPPALTKKDVQDTLFTDEEFQALMSGQCELLSFSDNDLRSPSSLSPLLSLQMKAQLLCRDDDAYAGPLQETPPSFSFNYDLDEPISDEDIERLAPLFCDEEIQSLCAASQQQEASMQQFSSDDDQAGKNRMSSPPWPSCIADEDDNGEDEAGPPPLALPPPPPTKKARSKTSRKRREHVPPVLLPLPSPPPIKKARTTQQTKTRSRREAAAAASAARLRKWHKKIATRILTRQFQAPELSRGRAALRCQCAELALADEHEPRRFVDCCALHQNALPEDMAWMDSAQGHGAPPLVGWPGEVLVPAVSAGSSRAMVLQYTRWRRSVSLPTRFYVQRAVEKVARSAAA